MADRTVIFIIPAYNEEHNIEILLEQTAGKMREIGYPYRIIIIDDGSTDGTRRAVEHCARRMPIRLVSHAANKGVGEAFRNGFKAALEECASGDIIVTKEADNTSDLGILADMLKKIDEGYDVVLASCYAKGGKIIGSTPDRLFLSSIANLLLRIFLPIGGVRTYSSFYRAYCAGSMKSAFDAYGGQLMEENGFACMVEMLVNASRLPMRITEVPMVLRCDFRKGKSKMKKAYTMMTYIRLIAKKFRQKNAPKSI